jgi:16S rRNA (uracil1498-N3)-methyltransferase
MRRRFFASPDQIGDSTIMLSADESYHLARVLRMRPGDEAFVFDGDGREFRCKIAAITGDRARLEIIEALTNAVESPLSLTLAQSIAKAEKFDLIVQKATELGASRIVPLVSDRTEVRLSAEGAQKRLERWRRISLEALKQCGRRRLVHISAPLTLREFLNSGGGLELASGAGFEVAVLAFSEKGGLPIGEALAGASNKSAFVALIGPEGGWSSQELTLMERFGSKAVTLGPRLLRTETAAIVALALLQHELGDLSRIEKHLPQPTD